MVDKEKGAEENENGGESSNTGFDTEIQLRKQNPLTFTAALHSKEVKPKIRDALDAK